LSFPEVFADITRPGFVEVTALNGKGERIQFRCGGLLGRVVQHEFDHLQGILFIDRMEKEKKAELKSDLEALQTETKAALKNK
jgi:peptide deformylase